MSTHTQRTYVACDHCGYQLEVLHVDANFRDDDAPADLTISVARHRCNLEGMVDDAEQRQADYETVQAMKRWGGSFVQSLAAAWPMADDANRIKIRETWPEYWSQYDRMAAAQRNQNGNKWYEQF